MLSQKLQNILLPRQINTLILFCLSLIPFIAVIALCNHLQEIDGERLIFFVCVYNVAFCYKELGNLEEGFH